MVLDRARSHLSTTFLSSELGCIITSNNWKTGVNVVALVKNFKPEVQNVGMPTFYPC